MKYVRAERVLFLQFLHESHHSLFHNPQRPTQLSVKFIRWLPTYIRTLHGWWLWGVEENLRWFLTRNFGHRCTARPPQRGSPQKEKGG